MAIQLFKRANRKISSEKDSKDPEKQKWNASDVCVQIGDEFIPVSELVKLNKVNKTNVFVPLQKKVENEMEIDGEVQDMGALIELYKSSRKNSDDNSDKNDPALQAAIKGMKKYDSKGNEIAGAVEDNEDEASKKAKPMKMNDDDAGQKELEKGEEGAEKVVVRKGKNKKMKDNETPAEKGDKSAVSKENEEDVEDKDEEKKENETDDEEDKENAVDEDESLKEQIKKQSKTNSKDVRHFLRLNSARENGDAGGSVLTIDTMHSRVGRGVEKYGSGR